MVSVSEYLESSGLLSVGVERFWVTRGMGNEKCVEEVFRFPKLLTLVGSFQLPALYLNFRTALYKPSFPSLPQIFASHDFFREKRKNESQTSSHLLPAIMGKSLKKVPNRKGERSGASSSVPGDGIPVARHLDPVTAVKRGFTVTERKDMKVGWGGPTMEPDLWWNIQSKLLHVEADGAEALCRARGVVAWASPQGLPSNVPIDPKIQLERSKFAEPAELATLNETFFAPSTPMRVLGHVACHIKEGAEGFGSERYGFAHEGGFLFNEYVLQNVGIRFPFSDFEMEVLNYMNCAPAQLHPNSWRLLAILQNVAAELEVELTAKVLFYAYRVESKNGGWVSLHCMNKPGRYSVLSANVSSVKKWTNYHFFVSWEPADRRPWYLDDEGYPRFPLSWSEPIVGQRVLERESLSPEEHRAVKRLLTAPKQDGNDYKTWGKCQLTDVLFFLLVFCF